MKRLSFLAFVALLLLVAPMASARVLDGGGLPDITKEATGPLTTVDYGLDSSIICTPPSGSQFALGTTPVSCTTDDGTGNQVPYGSFNVIIQDTTPPSDPSGGGPQTLEATSPSGAVATFSLTSTDLVDPSPSVNCTPSSGSTFPLGQTQVSCFATDSSGNKSGTTNFTITVQDTTKPTINVPSNITAEATSSSGAAVNFTVTASDTADSSPDVNCDHASGSTFPFGDTTVNCTATDDSNNSASGSFKVTVHDTTAPSLSLPGNITTNAPNYSPIAVNFSVSATDSVDGSRPVTCDHAPGSSFPTGTTTVNCSASDTHGNTAHGSFTVTVNVTDQPPVLSNVPGPIQREANGPQGSIVTFTNPTAVDDIDGPIPNVNCSPASGSTFPLGTTTVNCSASDSHGHVGTASFQVKVVDTTPPVLTLPGNRTVHATSSAGIATAFMTALASAHDIVDPHPRISSNAPDIAPVGKTVISFTATDASGNSTTGTSTLTVLAIGDTTPLPPEPDVRPPGDVRNLKAKAGDKLVVLTWDKSPANDVKSYVVTRSVNQGTARTLAATGDATTVYQGTGTTFTDRRLKNGVEYRYTVVTIDGAGNRSAGSVITATPKRDPLRKPSDGSALRRKTKVVRLDWDNVPNASYYNVQLFYGNVKVLSVWPKTSAYTLHRSWKYLRHSYALKPGVYRWYVWAGFGPRSDVNYGPVLGPNSFVVKP